MILDGLAGAVELSWWAWDRAREAVLDGLAYVILRLACRARRHNETCPAWHRPHPTLWPLR